jgi:hypothetical protein
MKSKGDIMMASFRKMGLAGMVLLASVMLAGSSAQGGTITENFDNNQYNTQWWGTGSEGPGATAIVTGNRLEIGLPASAGGTLYMGGIGFERNTLIGDFDMQFDFTLLNWPATNGSQITMGAYFRKPVFFNVNRRSQMPQPNENGQEVYYTLVTGQQIYDPVPASGTAGKLRMTRTGSMMAGFYWNGAAWLSIGSATAGDLSAPCQFYINFNRDMIFSGPAVQVAIDNIQVTYTSLGPALGNSNLSGMLPLLLE